MLLPGGVTTVCNRNASGHPMAKGQRLARFSQHGRSTQTNPRPALGNQADLLGHSHHPPESRRRDVPNGLDQEETATWPKACVNFSQQLRNTGHLVCRVEGQGKVERLLKPHDG